MYVLLAKYQTPFYLIIQYLVSHHETPYDTAGQSITFGTLSAFFYYIDIISIIEYYSI
jgi:hypothetical protein